MDISTIIRALDQMSTLNSSHIWRDWHRASQVYTPKLDNNIARTKIQNFILKYIINSRINELILMQHEDMECKICYSFKKSTFTHAGAEVQAKM